MKLLSESSIGAGVRRVEALVGADAFSYLAREHILLNSLTEIIKGARVEELPERISDLLGKMKTLEKELATFKSAQALASVNDLAKKFEEIGKFKVLISQVADGISGDDLRVMTLDLRNRDANAVVGLLSVVESRVVLAVAATPDAIASGIKAGALVKSGSAILGGGGGGKDDFAQGGGSDASKIDSAISELKAAIGSI